MKELIANMQKGDRKALARAVSMTENGVEGYRQLLQELPEAPKIPVIGVTGPPGAGKSSLINALIRHMISENKKVAVIAIDPSSPFNKGAIMGDRIRMSEHFLDPSIFIRSMATRGHLGGLAPKVFEVADILRSSGFDYIIIETVGVGQSEVEIAALADITVLVLVPEAGDEVQAMKSGVMEIADLYVVNKSDREGADLFFRELLTLVHSGGMDASRVIKTTAIKDEGIDALLSAIKTVFGAGSDEGRKAQLLAERAMVMIRDLRTKDIDFNRLKQDIVIESGRQGFNLYRYIEQYAGSTP